EEEYARRTTDEWVQALEKLDIPVARVNTLSSLMHDPHLQDVGFFQWAEHPSQGRIRTMAQGTEWSATPPDVRRMAPRLGEHSAELLAELGYSPEEIEAMHKAGTTLSGKGD